MDAEHTGHGTLLRGTRRHWWLPLITAVAGLGVGAGLLLTQPIHYSASTSVLVQPVPAAPTSTSSATDANTGASLAPVNLGTEAQLVRSTETARRAAALLQTATPPADLVDSVTVDPIADTSVLIVHFEADSPASAQAGAKAFATAYLGTRADAASAALADRKGVLASSLADANSQLTALDATIGRLPLTSAQLPTLRSNRTTLAGQITTLTARISDLTTTVVNAGQVIRDADLPTSPMSRLAWLFLAGGLAGGLMVGLSGAQLWERVAVRVRDGTDVIERAGVELLAELDFGEAALHATSDAASRDYHRLRNEVVASLGSADRVLLLTSASPGPASTVVAANLAAALARVGHEVVLLGANAPAIGTTPVLLSTLFDISDIPGLTNVLSGRTDLGVALQVPPREPRMRVVSPGGAASASRLLQSSSARATVVALRQLARFVLIDSPSAASGADAQSLAGLADAAIVVVETGQSRHSEVADAVAQLRLVGARVLGAVLVPKLVSPPEPEESEPVPTHRWTIRADSPFGPISQEIPREPIPGARPAVP